ncbi:MAG: MmgE/PrpD family protein [Deltaproteobacteria bacterium]|nr:MmgE/PrpD family protein [Deltaproteobacteria bacterium]
MPSLLHRLARWAADLDVAAAPDELLTRVRAQHLNLAGATLAAGATSSSKALLPAPLSRGGSPTLGTDRQLPRRDATRAHAALAAAYDHDDLLFGAPVGVGAASVVWALPKGSTVGDALSGTLAGNELAGRLALALALSPGCRGGALGPVLALAAATAAARAQRLDAATTAQALALALSAAGALSPAAQRASATGRGVAYAAQVMIGVDAVEQARAGAQGPTALLDDDAWLQGISGAPPLREAFGGLGAVWLTDHLSLKRLPGDADTLTAVEGIAEILQRHVKAAEKRLRADQIDHIDVRLPARSFFQQRAVAELVGLDAGLITRSIPRAAAVLAIAYELGAAQLSPEWLEERREAIDELARRVHLFHDWSLTTKQTVQSVVALAPLLGDHRQAKAAARRFLGGARSLPAPASLEEWTETARARPDRLFTARSGNPGDLSALGAHVGAFVPVEVKLYTTRGGWWPERRATLDGDGGLGAERLYTQASQKYAAGVDLRVNNAKALRGLALGEPAEALVSLLNAG